MTDIPKIVNDLSGQRFGRLTVKSFSGSKRYVTYSRAYWKCVCDCGNELDVKSDSLISGHTKSCGCYLKDTRNENHGSRTPYGHSSLNKVYHNYKSDAIKRGLDFSLSKDDFSEIIKQDCIYCGSPPSNYYEVKGCNGGILYNGIDRIDSHFGYVIGNIVPCCGFCNRAKYEYDVKEFLLWINRLKSHKVDFEEIENASRELT